MPELDTFVKDARDKGLDDDIIRKALLSEGWDSSLVTAALTGVAVPKPATEQEAAHGSHPKRPSLSPLMAAMHHILLWFFTGSSEGSCQLSYQSSTFFAAGFHYNLACMFITRHITDRNSQSVIREYARNNFRPFNNSDRFRIVQRFVQFICHDTCVLQTVKVVVRKLHAARRVIHAANRKAWALNPFVNSHTIGNPFCQRRLTSANVTDKFNHLAATKQRT